MNSTKLLTWHDTARNCTTCFRGQQRKYWIAARFVEQFSSNTYDCILVLYAQYCIGFVVFIQKGTVSLLLRRKTSYWDERYRGRPKGITPISQLVPFPLDPSKSVSRIHNSSDNAIKRSALMYNVSAALRGSSWLRLVQISFEIWRHCMLNSLLEVMV